MKKQQLFLLSLLLTFGLLLTACTSPPEEKKKIMVGAVNYFPPLDLTFQGFKEGMTELGYVEGEDFTLIYNGVVAPDPESIGAEVDSLMEQGVDLFFTMGTPTTLAAKAAVEGTEIPVIFAPLINPVAEGAVDDVRFPGGNVTGIRNDEAVPKSLEWMQAIAPDVKKVYIPYHPADEVSKTSIIGVEEAATVLGMELIIEETTSPEAVLAGIEALPDDVGGILFVPLPSLQANMTDYVDAATERGMVSVSLNTTDVDMGVVLTYWPDLFLMGKQAAHMADRVLRGNKPADMPVESPEYFLNINVKTAAAIGLDIPDEILRQATTIVR